jgi:hypothetical protein
MAPILDEVGKMVLDFVSFCVKHIGRSANNLAHLCAKLACTLESTSSWLDESLAFLVSSCRLIVQNHYLINLPKFPANKTPKIKQYSTL